MFTDDDNKNRNLISRIVSNLMKQESGAWKTSSGTGMRVSLKSQITIAMEIIYFDCFLCVVNFAAPNLINFLNETTKI